MEQLEDTGGVLFFEGFAYVLEHLRGSWLLLRMSAVCSGVAPHEQSDKLAPDLAVWLGDLWLHCLYYCWGAGVSGCVAEHFLTVQFD